MTNKQKMYRLTGAVKKKNPGLQKKRNQRFFVAPTNVALAAMESPQYKTLSSEFGFSIQTTIV